ncbi:hypothetical protein K438DRAFT_1921263 [Mycena galopus ATCC 62051]|nr:hypothetical protein K438DRAFT_1921263 [Mycena galopus ATCC 62051]
MLFRLHTFILKTTSSWFRAMLSLPQGQAPPIESVIFMEEDEDTLELLLRMVSGLPLLPIEHYDMVDKILFAAEKYDMPGPSCRYGWENEARVASTQTLTHHLHDPEIRPRLERLSSNALLNLFSLHHSRKEALRDRLNKPPFVASDYSANCGNCHSPIDYHTWRELKYRMIQEIEIRPLGDTIIDKGLTDWPEAKTCWMAKCPNRVCARSLYDQEPTMRIIRECIDELPRSI